MKYIFNKPEFDQIIESKSELNKKQVIDFLYVVKSENPDKLVSYRTYIINRGFEYAKNRFFMIDSKASQKKLKKEQVLGDKMFEMFDNNKYLKEFLEEQYKDRSFITKYRDTVINKLGDNIQNIDTYAQIDRNVKDDYQLYRYMSLIYYNKMTWLNLYQIGLNLFFMSPFAMYLEHPPGIEIYNTIRKNQFKKFHFAIKKYAFIKSKDDIIIGYQLKHNIQWSNELKDPITSRYSDLGMKMMQEIDNQILNASGHYVYSLPELTKQLTKVVNILSLDNFEKVALKLIKKNPDWISAGWSHLSDKNQNKLRAEYHANKLNL